MLFRSGLKLCPTKFQADRAKIWRKLAKNRQKTGFLLPLSPPRLINLEACYLYHLNVLGLKLCPTKFQADRAKNLAKIGENPLKHFVSVSPVCYNLQ